MAWKMPHPERGVKKNCAPHNDKFVRRTLACLAHLPAIRRRMVHTIAGLGALFT
jgi:hypothetical protein